MYSTLCIKIKVDLQNYGSFISKYLILFSELVALADKSLSIIKKNPKNNNNKKTRHITWNLYILINAKKSNIVVNKKLM